MTQQIHQDLCSELKPVLLHSISDELVQSMRRIEPLLRVPDSQWYRRIDGIEKIDARAVSFLWNAMSTGKKLAFGPLSEVQIITYHTWGFHGFFKPSLAEVYSAIYQTCPTTKDIKYFYLHSYGMGAENIIGNYHYCKCSLFGEASREE